MGNLHRPIGVVDLFNRHGDLPYHKGRLVHFIGGNQRRGRTFRQGRSSNQRPYRNHSGRLRNHVRAQSFWHGF